MNLHGIIPPSLFWAIFGNVVSTRVKSDKSSLRGCVLVHLNLGISNHHPREPYPPFKTDTM